MVEYVDTSNCRSRFISYYFGDESAADCGICDACLAKKATVLAAAEFNTIAAAILSHLTQNKATATDLLTQLKTVRQEKAWEVIRFLQAEKKIITSTEGWLSVSQ